MGGTSFDVCVVGDGRVTSMTQGEIDGLPVRLPMVEIRTIGAGGGSIASVLPGRAAGRRSRKRGRPTPARSVTATAAPAPTVTDANLVLGRLDAGFFLGGKFALDGASARSALASEIGDRLSLGIEAAAEGLLTLTNASLAAAIRLSLFEKGLDPRHFALLSFGGAGGLHAIDVADELGIDRVVFPADASTFSASGILRSDIMHDLASSRVLRAGPAIMPELTKACAALREQGHALLEQDGVAPDRRVLRFAADMRYHGQAFELVIPWDDIGSLDALLGRFHAIHEQRFSYANPDDPVEIVTLRLTAIGKLPEIVIVRELASPETLGRRRRPVFLAGAWQDVAVHRRAELTGPVQGPALIEEAYTTVFVGTGWRCAPDPGGDLIADRMTAEAEPGTPSEIGTIELEIMRNALTSAAAEMDVTIWRTSRSTIVRELLDYSTAIFTADGDNVAQSARIPQHLNSMGAGLQAILRDFIPAAEWHEGDVVITNDPYCGGQHIPDILAFRPVFDQGVLVAPGAEGVLVAIVGTLCHHLDMGGIAAGSYGANATEIFQEGLRIPPMMLVRGGAMNREVLAMMRQNVRRPDMLWGDLQAQLASLAVGVANVIKLCERYGGPTLVAACGRMLDSSEAAMRGVIGRMPDGMYTFKDFIDDDGLTDTPIRIHAAIEDRRRRDGGRPDRLRRGRPSARSMRRSPRPARPSPMR